MEKMKAINEVSELQALIMRLFPPHEYGDRITLFIALCRVIARNNEEDHYSRTNSIVWKSTRYADGTVMDRWFILGLNKQKGQQITYHLPLSRWNECSFAETLPNAPEWDGHISEDVITRLKSLSV
jgi:hypothetical protein